ncbi:hypothetical protein SO802_014604 [Lithocarpus litseifolius]|uniref:Uncharacterized protein n=1 Tax=Lithocarpus litseifolius TaxID=425828 RepID=A0AAW2CTH3_9ROSI
MGNCIRHESSVQWGGDDWGSAEKDELYGNDTDCGMGDNNNAMIMEEKGLLGGAERSFTKSSSTTTTTTEVKIKITKKQLEELLGKADLKELSVQQVLAQLISVSGRFDSHPRSWRPALQSIPEVN